MADAVMSFPKGLPGRALNLLVTCWAVLLFRQAEGAAGGDLGVLGQLALPCAIPGRPAEAVLFQGLALLVVGLFVKIAP